MWARVARLARRVLLVGGVEPTHPSARGPVAASLRDQHRRMAAALERIVARAAEGAWRLARAECATLRVKVAAHHRFEEEEVFPRVDERGPARATRVLRHEHNVIEEALAHLEAAAARADRRRFSDAVGQVRAVLPEHELKEEHLVLPWLDGTLSA